MMNLTLDQFIDGFERSAKEMPALLAEWDTIDEELRENYSEQLTWMLEHLPEVIQFHTRDRFSEISDRIHAVFVALEPMKDEIHEKMGVTKDNLSRGCLDMDYGLD